MIVYTTIFGGSNSLKPAPIGADRCVCFVDAIPETEELKGWELIHWRFPSNEDPRRMAWHLRCVSHKLFPDADHTVWIDASFTLTNLPLLLEHAGKAPIAGMRHEFRQGYVAEGQEVVRIGQADDADVARQIMAYCSAGFRCSYVTCSQILVRDNSEKVRAFNETWDAEIKKYPGDNTQISIDYSAWKHGLKIKALQGIRGSNPYAIHDARDHKRRRKPYQRAVLA